MHIVTSHPHIGPSLKKPGLGAFADGENGRNKGSCAKKIDSGKGLKS